MNGFNKRGEAGDNPLEYNVIYIMLFLIILGPTFMFVNSQREGASLWEDFYAKEIARIIDISEPGTEAWLDVTKAVEVAEKRNLQDKEEVFNFNNIENEVIVRLRRDGATGFKFFNNVDVVDWKIEEKISSEEGKNKIYLLYFKITEAQK